jgi:hypothetical protein
LAGKGAQTASWISPSAGLAADYLTWPRCIRQRRLIESSSSQQIVQVVLKSSFLLGALCVLAVLQRSHAGLIYRHHARIRWVRDFALPQLGKPALEGKARHFIA